MMSLGDLLVALACGLGQEFQPGQRRGHGVPPPLAVPDGLAQVLRGTAAVERLGDQGGTGAVGENSYLHRYRAGPPMASCSSAEAATRAGSHASRRPASYPTTSLRIW